MYERIIKKELESSLNLLEKILKNESYIKKIELSADIIVDSFKKGKKVISCGNGGSHCDAMHFAEELTGCYRKIRKGYPAISISDSSYFTCVSNDIGYNYVFSRFISTLGKEGDVLLAITTSGNSENILKAIKSAYKKNMKVIVLTGNNGGKVKGIANIEICVPYIGYADRIQEIHIKIIHILIYLIEIKMKNSIIK
ncbi:D-sedoheptulose 7-phosphate isomerase [Buchnera aphidicola]|uniref:Phosphoheptose isomerase n=1 Tax=Buchnera aphidicola (Anoecia oenotherae) TaxID=1241833 RepID=A0A4D6XXW6_9GAMM|nr:D-sedoheptulose 7-phosphate isomerase [Buchnera aphidicola]QCI19324.1 D-sedoheptulose 7-phosphate isomerase [Buchnera aphidicola (Anoecia oenotherae)]